ncbi:MAG: DEAD/DEAH box helicase family protein, partial [Chloroflexota bacterium]
GIFLPCKPFPSYCRVTSIKLDQPNFLADLTPGAGKTILAARIAHAGLSDGRYEQILVACPTELLKVQWMEKLALVGIEINPYYNSGDLLQSGYRGAALTYSQISRGAPVFRMLSSRHKTLVIMDEPHHLGENKTWGDSIRFAFDNAVARLLITGTAWRSDNNPIPYVEYPNGEGKSHYVYSYKDAIRDGVCRYVVFPTYEGTMEWVSGRSGEIQQASFKAQMNEQASSERLRTALNPNGEWIAQVLRDAHTKLMECRTMGHPNAGGLIVCIDERHAQRMAEVVKRITNCTPLVVTSNTTDADMEIERFAKSTQEWLIAIKMVSEGVDIPRLRVGVYATNVTTDLFFCQFVGRFVRWTNGLPEQTAYVYIPEDARIAACAYGIAQERNHVLREETAEDEYDEWIDPRDGEVRVAHFLGQLAQKRSTMALL